MGCTQWFLFAALLLSASLSGILGSTESRIQQLEQTVALLGRQVWILLY